MMPSVSARKVCGRSGPFIARGSSIRSDPTSLGIYGPETAGSRTRDLSIVRPDSLTIHVQLYTL